MISLFILTLLGTLIVTRVIAHLFHFKEKTITSLIRRKTKLDFHHFHLGISLFIISALIISISELLFLSIIIFAIGLSLIADQIYPIINRKADYFSKKCLSVSIILHLIIILLYILININQ